MRLAAPPPAVAAARRDARRGGLRRRRAPARRSRRPQVSMAKSYRFDPKTIEVKAGDTVTWTNNDNFTHTVQGRRPGRPQGRPRRQRLDHVRQARHLPLRLHAAQPRHARDGDRHVTLAELRVDVVILACAISAGIHGALVPEHFEEGTRRRASASSSRPSLLAALAVALTLRPTRARAARDGRVVRRPDRRATRSRSRPGCRCCTPSPSRSTGSRSSPRRSRPSGLVAAAALAARARRSPCPPTPERNADMNTRHVRSRSR